MARAGFTRLWRRPVSAGAAAPRAHSQPSSAGSPGAQPRRRPPNLDVFRQQRRALLVTDTIQYEAHGQPPLISDDFQGSGSWTHPGVTPRCVIVFICAASGTVVVGRDEITGVTYGGRPMNEIAVSPILFTAAGFDGAGAVHLYILDADDLPTGSQTVAVTAGANPPDLLTNFCCSYTLSGDSEIELAGGVLWSSQSIVDPLDTVQAGGGRRFFCATAGLSGENEPGGVAPLGTWTTDGRSERDLVRQVGFHYRYPDVQNAPINAGWLQPNANWAAGYTIVMAEVDDTPPDLPELPPSRQINP